MRLSSTPANNLMYIIKVVAAVKGMDNHMEADFVEMVEDALGKLFGKFGVFEVLVVKEEIAGNFEGH